VPGFYDAVRANVISLLGITFQRIHKAVLCKDLNLTEAEVDKLVGGKVDRRVGRGVVECGVLSAGRG
jgi:hypothetical protein